MHDQEKAARSKGAAVRTAEVGRAAGPSAQQRGVLGLQGSVGNAAVVQMLRQADHAWAQEEHRHGAGCGHQQAESVQRSAVHDVLRGSGSPLDDSTRTDMEARLGADFSDVRIHDDSAAKASAAEVGARAYTSGNHVVIGAGGGDSHTLAHELTHVIQQRKGPVAGTDNGDGLKVSDPSDRFEREAEANAHRVMASAPQVDTDVQREAATDVQRQVAPGPAAASLPAVQRVFDQDNPGNPQNVMTTEHWERQAGVVGGDGKATKEMTKTKTDLMASAKKAKKGYKADKPRTIDEIIKTVGPALLQQLQGLPETSGRLELYRSMSLGEAQSILGYWGTAEARTAVEEYIRGGEGSAKDFRTQGLKGMTVGSHLGDSGQADAYYAMMTENYQVQLRFTLKPGAHQLLFNSDHMALGPGYKTELIRKGEGGGHKKANANEGTLPGYIGVKAEDNEPYSIGIAQGANGKNGREVGPSQLLFQLFLQDVSLVKDKTNTLGGE
ncbi:eCIS core domain-containing protein [Streptomyces xanthochromogenes]|uniref:eCIS core domain-containing protein n=1 Tax=Streptomyces xanthochromogenes TaxID=67384 RepID=UPI003F4D50A2